MGEETRKLDLRPLLAAAAVVALALTMWATGAFAAGGSPPSGDVPGAVADSPFVQDGGEGQAPSREDCPKDGGGGAAPEGSGSDGSGSPDL